MLPGFGLSLGYSVAYLSLIVLLPLAALAARAGTLGWDEFRRIVLSEQVLGAYRLTIGASALAALANVGVGFLIAWVLGRYAFPGRRVMDAVIDLPFALPTAVAGIALAFLYSDRGWVGRALDAAGFAYPWPAWRGFGEAGGGGWPVRVDWYDRVTRTPLGVVVALMFVGLPFVVRTVQPVVRELEREAEEASVSLGAGPWLTFRRVVLPQLVPALITGFALAFARGLGEYGSVIFIAGNRPQTQITAHQIILLMEEDDTFAAPTAVAVVLLATSFVLLLAINAFQRRVAGRGGSAVA
ncbi:MAG: sulfate/thiosulfate transporter subunit [Phycisphaerales bacterium]|nr:sulfate/thiosulfate transporter subunit [Phycisphaerales bacterium]